MDPVEARDELGAVSDDARVTVVAHLTLPLDIARDHASAQIDVQRGEQNDRTRDRRDHKGVRETRDLVVMAITDGADRKEPLCRCVRDDDDHTRAHQKYRLIDLSPQEDGEADIEEGRRVDERWNDVARGRDERF